MQNYITLNQERLSKVFITMPISYEWFFALNVGKTKFYSNDAALLNYYYDLESGILVINSMARNNKNFPKSMLLDIRKLIISYDKVIIASSVQEISQHMFLKYGFNYDKDKQIYMKGV